MRVPDNNDACDHHVRFAYHKMFGIVSSPYNKDYSYIELAQTVKPDGVTGTFEDSNSHKCFDNDDQGMIQNDSVALQNALSQANNADMSMLGLGFLESADNPCLILRRNTKIYSQQRLPCMMRSSEQANWGTFRGSPRYDK